MNYISLKNILFIPLLLLVVTVVGAQTTPGNNPRVTGYMWNSVAGWVSLSSANHTNVGYVFGISPKLEDLSDTDAASSALSFKDAATNNQMDDGGGYFFSQIYGWISTRDADVGGCSDFTNINTTYIEGGDDCAPHLIRKEATLTENIEEGNFELLGFAKIMSTQEYISFSSKNFDDNAAIVYGVSAKRNDTCSGSGACSIELSGCAYSRTGWWTIGRGIDITHQEAHRGLGCLRSGDHAGPLNHDAVEVKVPTTHLKSSLSIPRVSVNPELITQENTAVSLNWDCEAGVANKLIRRETTGSGTTTVETPGFSPPKESGNLTINNIGGSTEFEFECVHSVFGPSFIRTNKKSVQLTNARLVVSVTGSTIATSPGPGRVVTLEIEVLPEPVTVNGSDRGVSCEITDDSTGTSVASISLRDGVSSGSVNINAPDGAKVYKTECSYYSCPREATDGSGGCACSEVEQSSNGNFCTTGTVEDGNVTRHNLEKTDLTKFTRLSRAPIGGGRQ